MPTLAELILQTVQCFSPIIYAECAPRARFNGGLAYASRRPTSGRTGSAIKTRTRYHTETRELQWEYLSGAATKSIVDEADILEVDSA